MPTSESSPAARSDTNLPIENSDTSHSRNCAKRKKVSSTENSMQFSAMPSAATRPLTRSRTWS